MISEALVAQGIRREVFSFIPFPIEKPAKLPQFLPVSIPCFTTISMKSGTGKKSKFSSLTDTR